MAEGLPVNGVRNRQELPDKDWLRVCVKKY